MMSSTTTAAAARDFIDHVWNDPAGLGKLEHHLSPTYIDHAYNGGRPEFERAFTELHGAFTQVHFVIDDLVAEYDRAAARIRLKAVHSGAFRSMQATGRAIEVNLFRWYRVEAGRIAEHWASFDTASLLRQIQA